MEWVSGLVSLQTDLLKNIVNKEDKNDKKIEETEEDVVKEETDDTDLKCNESLEEDDLSQSVSPSSTLSTCSLSPRHRHQLSGVSTAGFSSLVTMLSEYLAQHSHHDISAMDPVVVQYLAHRQLQALMSAEVGPGADISIEVQARASLTPLHSRKSPVLMRYRTLTIGAGAGAGLDLSQYGHCNYLSSKHATIFYDELSDSYELLNYSPHGTVVDEVMYGLDTCMVGARYKHVSGDQVTMSSGAGTIGSPGCYCDADIRPGCESSALLRHGALLQFGCLQFVFSVAEMGRGSEMSVEL